MSGSVPPDRKKPRVTFMADEEAIQRKRERLAIVTYEYFWKACPKLTTRWRQAMLTLSPSVLQDLAVELQGLVLVTKLANQELRKARVRGMNGDVPVEDLLDRALASMERLREAANTMTRLLDELLKA
jgi:hypothetical protein